MLQIYCYSLVNQTFLIGRKGKGMILYTDSCFSLTSFFLSLFNLSEAQKWKKEKQDNKSIRTSKINILK